MIDPEFDRLPAKLGETRRVYRAPVWRIWVAIFVMFFVGIMSITIACFGDKRPGAKTDPTITALIVGIGALGVAAGILIHHFRTRNLRILVCSDGLVLDDSSSRDCYRWDDIVRIQEESQGDSIHFLPVGRYRAAVIEFTDGKTLFLNRNRVGRVGDLIDDIQRSVWSHHQQIRLASRDPELARLVAAWATLSKTDRGSILAIVNGFEFAPGS